MYLFDYHIHSTNSGDGKSTVDEICKAAIKNGLREIVITDHFEPTKKNKEYSSYNPEKCNKEIVEAREKYKKRIKLKFGIEMGQSHKYKEYGEKYLNKFNYDYVLGSIHKIGNDLDLSIIELISHLDYYCKMYLEELKGLAKNGNFDCLAHLDIISRYAANSGIRLNLIDYKEEVSQILKIVIERGKGLEINTSGLRQKAKVCFPNLEILTLYKNLGGEILTVGSDAHLANDIGKGLLEAYEMAKVAGFKYLTTYDNRKSNFIKL